MPNASVGPKMKAYRKVAAHAQRYELSMEGVDAPMGYWSSR